MDWGRYLRALEAEAIQAVEIKRTDALAKQNFDALTATEWERIQRHDELMERYGDKPD